MGAVFNSAKALPVQVSEEKLKFRFTFNPSLSPSSVVVVVVVIVVIVVIIIVVVIVVVDVDHIDTNALSNSSGLYHDVNHQSKKEASNTEIKIL